MERWQNGSKTLLLNLREEYFSRPVRNKPLYLIDYKRYVEIVRIPAGSHNK
jgi:hypothetical protein